MADKVLRMYLAGAIRDDHPEDIAWREDVITALRDHPVSIMSPLGGKTMDADGNWTVSGAPSDADFITNHDQFYVQESDIVLFNFRALSQGYPNIGTLVEFGWATAPSTRKKLIYAILDPDYTGHGNTKMFKLHPFLGKFIAKQFATVEDAIAFLRKHVYVIAGTKPRFIPPIIDRIEHLRAIDDQYGNRDPRLYTTDEVADKSR
jgi:nucleoside 2-deoxyribosyltransferase